MQLYISPAPPHSHFGKGLTEFRPAAPAVVAARPVFVMRHRAVQNVVIPLGRAKPHIADGNVDELAGCLVPQHC